MATFVLVHGAWHGGWCWQRVASRLCTAGHEVYAPTLTGLGERVHLLSPTVDLETHIRDVINVLDYEDLQRVVLVGHSYGGMVIAGVADRATDRLAHVVYLDTIVPRDGASGFTVLPAERVAALQEQVRLAGEGWLIPSPPVERFGVTAVEDVQWAAPKLVPQPLATFTQPLRLTDRAAALPKTYILCTANPNSFRPFAEPVRGAPGWRYRELHTGHDAMITAPRELADLLLEIVQ